MKTLTMKLPEGLLSWLETEAKRARQPKSALVREILRQHQQRQHPSALDLTADLCGCAESGLGDLARNKKHLKGFGRSVTLLGQSGHVNTSAILDAGWVALGASGLNKTPD